MRFIWGKKQKIPNLQMFPFMAWTEQAQMIHRTGQLFNVVLLLLLITQSCPTLCDPMHCSLAGSSVRGTPQARILEWVAISFSNLIF